MGEPADGDVTEVDYEEVTGDPLGLFAVADSARRGALVEAYWKLRDHARELRSTEVYRKASELRYGTNGEALNRQDSPAYQRYRWLEATARGIEDGARDVAELLGIEEHEIERPKESHG